MKESVGLGEKIYSYLKDNNDEDKAKWKRKCFIKRKVKLEDYKNCLEASQIDVDRLKEFINNKLILKTQQIFNRKRHNVFTEKINKIALNSNDDKTMQSIDSIETYAHGTSKGLLYKKEEI